MIEAAERDTYARELANIIQQKLDSGDCFQVPQWTAIRFVESAITGARLIRDSRGAVSRRPNDRWLVQIAFENYGSDAEPVPPVIRGKRLWIIPLALDPTPYETFSIGRFRVGPLVSLPILLPWGWLDRPQERPG